MAVEYVKYGKAEGGLNDIRQLDSFLRALKVSPAFLRADLLLPKTTVQFQLCHAIAHEAVVTALLTFVEDIHLNIDAVLVLNVFAMRGCGVLLKAGD